MAINELNQGGQQVSTYAELSEHAEIEGVSGKKVFIVSPDGNQSQLDTLIETLQELTQRLAPLAGAMATNATLRVSQLAVPSTAVTGPITSALSIAEKQLGGTSYPEKVAITNLTAIQSNINNCTGA